MLAGEGITRGLFRAEILIGGIPRAIYTGRDGYHWVAGVPGAVYQIRVNSLSGKIGVALAIDGRDALADRSASLTDPSLQIIRDQYTFKGFRVSDDLTRDFIFGTVRGSFVDQAVQVGSVGTIGIAAWREFPQVTYDSVPVAAGADYLRPRSPGLGTHGGEAKHDPVIQVDFERSGSPDVLEIGYDTFEALDRMGVTQRFAPRHPRAFPGTTTGYEKYDGPPLRGGIYP